MVPGRVIEAFPQGMVVMHPSLLPKYRGACPIQHAILNREKETGVSVIEISKRTFDAGDILLQQGGIEINDDTRFDELSERLAEAGGNALHDLLLDSEQSLNKFRS